MQDHYIWLYWSSAFLLPWVALFLAFPRHRKIMFWTSLATMPFGLTEPLFVPSYWNPPSLFDLAQRTGFDIESLIYAFAIGGLGTVLYNIFTKKHLHPMGSREQRQPLHRRHWVAMILPFALFIVLYFLPWNVIYPSITAMAAGAALTVYCRPDLKTKIWIGGLIFLGLYIILFQGLAWTVPGYIERVWNIPALSGIVIFHIPLEELPFGLTFGMFWSGIYEHITWTKPEAAHAHS